MKLSISLKPTIKKIGPNRPALISMYLGHRGLCVNLFYPDALIPFRVLIQQTGSPVFLPVLTCGASVGVKYVSSPMLTCLSSFHTPSNLQSLPACRLLAPYMSLVPPPPALLLSAGLSYAGPFLLLAVPL